MSTLDMQKRRYRDGLVLEDLYGSYKVLPLLLLYSCTSCLFLYMYLSWAHEPAAGTDASIATEPAIWLEIARRGENCFLLLFIISNLPSFRRGFARAHPYRRSRSRYVPFAFYYFLNRLVMLDQERDLEVEKERDRAPDPADARQPVVALLLVLVLDPLSASVLHLLETGNQPDVFVCSICQFLS